MTKFFLHSTGIDFDNSVEKRYWPLNAETLMQARPEAVTLIREKILECDYHPNGLTKIEILQVVDKMDIYDMNKEIEAERRKREEEDEAQRVAAREKHERELFAKLKEKYGNQ